MGWTLQGERLPSRRLFLEDCGTGCKSGIDHSKWAHQPFKVTKTGRRWSV